MYMLALPNATSKKIKNIRKMTNNNEYNEKYT